MLITRLLNIFILLTYEFLIEVQTLNSKKLNCGCGKFQGSSKLADGMSYVSGDFPWLVDVVEKGKVTKDNNRIRICWGTLISDRYVLTTATCLVTGLRWRSLDEIEVYFRRLNSKERPRRSVVSITIHDSYNRSTHSHNLALLELTRPLQEEILHENVLPICLPKESIRDKLYILNMLADGVVMIKSQNYRSAFFSSEKNYVAQLNTTISGHDFDKKNCTNIFTRRPKSNLCWDDQNLSCYGEHGSILAVKIETGVYGALGVYSKGFGCNEYSTSNEPADVLIEVSSNLEWIQQNTRDALYCRY